MESLYEYGSRAGFWRLHRLFTGKDMPVTGNGKVVVQFNLTGPRCGGRGRTNDCQTLLLDGVRIFFDS